MYRKSDDTWVMPEISDFRTICGMYKTTLALLDPSYTPQLDQKEFFPAISPRTPRTVDKTV